MKTVTIAGVGLIGGSFALALRKAGFDGKILGVSSPATLRAALDLSVIDDAPPLEEAFAAADLVYLAQPISRILESLRTIDPFLRPGTLVTDAGSTKSAIVRQASQTIRNGTFLGGHPMAGKAARGAAQADPDLFQARTYFLTPSASKEMEQSTVVTFVEWIRRIGANPVTITPEAHDHLVAFTSHLPQLASTALAGTLAQKLDADQARQGAGPGLHDTTRLALSSYEIWADILTTNGPSIAQALDLYIDRLHLLREHLKESNLKADFEFAENFTKQLRKPDF
ncbi:MAG: prephenate dehydrogenase/arogenate dehydrogenase family protein [Acidobacteriia bacterium]|nr:prephenate dehydrogenase/arogenate dehydrogenase family protein [Terriglobia bacterium]